MSDFGTLTMSVQGELELSTASDLVDELGEWLGIKECIIELDGCDFIDSTGVRALIECRHQIGPQGTLRLVGLAPHIERLLRQVGLDEIASLERAADEHTLESDGGPG
jgi:anti-anti-sigma factor